MNSIYKYDLFISYATPNRNIAEYILNKLEDKGLKCFIAPRDIKTGADYASEIVTGISNSLAMLLIFSKDSNKSGFVLREINSGVSRNKMIIPLKIEDFLPSDAMEFYLGPTHWLDAFPEVLDVHIEKIITLISQIDKNLSISDDKTIHFEGPLVLKTSEVKKIGYTNKQIILRTIELDYLCIPSDIYNMNEEQEGSFEDWCNIVSEHGEELAGLFVKNDEIIGYCELYPIVKDAYSDLIAGKYIVRDSIIDLYEFGGTFNVYITMIAIEPENASMKNYFMIFEWIFAHLKEWESRGILTEKIGISVYSGLLDKIVTQLGFEFKSCNPVKGKVYESEWKVLCENPLVKKRFLN